MARLMKTVTPSHTDKLDPALIYSMVGDQYRLGGGGRTLIAEKFPDTTCLSSRGTINHILDAGFTLALIKAEEPLAFATVEVGVTHKWQLIAIYELRAIEATQLADKVLFKLTGLEWVDDDVLIADAIYSIDDTTAVFKLQAEARQMLEGLIIHVERKSTYELLYELDLKGYRIYEFKSENTTMFTDTKSCTICSTYWTCAKIDSVEHLDAVSYISA